jgi:chromosome segregation protein
MYLKKLRLKNFKSFAGTTEIPFSPGFTGIAGPNGMGKSNISDAILFVLGPPSSKALRADRLTHLFFNGGLSKKPATECEVSLTFDNQDRLLGVDADEVTFTRYVKLAPTDPDGYYSYFYINERRSTQQEMETLLGHARLAGDGYNLIQQGMVNKIVAMTPLERRGIVEQVAGISQYDDELHRAEGKKEDLEKNLGEIRTLLGEVTRRLGDLEGQRTQALQHRKLTEERKVYEAQLARLNVARLRQEVAACEQKVHDSEEALKKIQARLQDLVQERTKVQSGIETLDTEIARQGGEEAQKLKKELDERKLALGRLEMEIQNLEQSRTESTNRLKQLETEIRQRQDEIRSQDKTFQETSQRLGEVEETLKDRSRQLEKAQESTSSLQGRAVELRKRVLEVQRLINTKQTQWQAAVEKAGQARTDAETALHDVSNAEELVKQRQMEHADVEYRAGELRSSKRGGERSGQELTEELHRARALEKSLRQEVEGLEKELLELNRAYAALEGRLKERAGAPGGSPGLAADFLMSEHNLGRLPGIRGKVEDLVTYDPEYSTALSVAAGTRFQALVVESDQVAAECIELLNKQKKGRVTLLPLNRMVSGRPKGKSLVVQRTPGCRGFAVDLIHADPELQPALWYVFGETLVMETLEQARAQMGGVRLVTLRGELLEASGAMTGGWLGPATKGRGADAAAELRQLGQQLRDKSAELERKKRELDQLSEEVRHLGEELARRSTETALHSSSLERLEKELAETRAALSQAQAALRSARARQAEAEKNAQVAESEADALHKELEKAKQELESTNREYLEALPSSVSERIAKLHDEIEALQGQRTELHGQVESLKATLASARATLADRETELKDLKSRLKQLSQAGTQKEHEREEARQKLEALNQLESRQSQVSQELQRQKDELQAKLVKIASEESALNSKHTSFSDILQDSHLGLDTARRELTEAEAALQEVPALPENTAPTSANPEDLRKRITEIDREIERLGPVNAQALEQYDQEKKRLEDFQGEVDRLNQEKDGLDQLVAEIEQKKRRRLVEVVKGIDEGYRQIYSELSGGGEGEIALENPEDPLAGGLLIRAKPLGKKVQRLEALSGGEKSLASLAFLFSLQRFDPSPLYVLDEVDMSLDGINAENIGRMLRRNSARAQFIVISLRKVTLKWAEHLYGVTMHGDGISRIVGISIDDIKDVDERELQAVVAPAAAAAVGGEAR